MALWVDQYRPSELVQLDYHPTITEHLSHLSNSEGFPHLLVFGPPGSGKKTRIMATLRALYGPGVEKIKVDQRILTTPSNRKIEVNLLVSNYHIEINPSDAGTQDRMIVQELIKEIAQTQTIDTSQKHRFKVVLLSEADQLSVPAQHALRRTMEKYMSNLRIIFCCQAINKIIPAIQSRCLLVQVPAPSYKEINDVLQQIAQKRGFRIDEILTNTMAHDSKRNLRRAILMLEALYATNNSPSYLSSHSADLSNIKFDWETYIFEMATQLVKEQSPESLLLLRSKFYELLAHCIPATLIIKTLAVSVAEKLEDSLKPMVFHEAAYYEHSLLLGNKPIFHLEAFAAKVMSNYKEYRFEHK